jgi:hypothetical protein
LAFATVVKTTTLAIALTFKSRGITLRAIAA